MNSKIIKYFIFLFLFTLLTAQEGCVTTDSLKKKQVVKEGMIKELQTEIMTLGGTPLTKDEAKYKGALGKDKYIKALKEQIAELKAKKDKEEADAKKKADELKAKKEKEDAEAKKKAEKAKKEKNRAAAIEAVKKEILFLGQTPIPEYEFTSEDKYIEALRKQIEEARKLKKEEELKINAEIPDWYQNMPAGSEMVMYARGSAVSADLDNSEQRAIENALIKLSGQMQSRINRKMNVAVREAGVDADLVLKSEMERTTSIVVKEVSISGYKVYKTKMAPVANEKYRTFIVIEFPISLAYKAYLTNIENNVKIKGNISKLKDTQAFKELEQYVAEFSGS
tara:strand:+ start:577 stop:1590 length:1014 start_codon:yes stop_codon:yes gene_type:complete